MSRGLTRILFTGLLIAATVGPLVAAEHRNVVLFVVDDQGFQSGCYGNSAIKTPALDSLAAAGTRFTRACCTLSLIHI